MSTSTYTGKTYTFNHGVHPEEFKELSSHCKVQRMPFVDEYTLPLGQHIGAPSRALVAKGEKVKRGQKIADAGGFVSVALHSPVDGIVRNEPAFPYLFNQFGTGYDFVRMIQKINQQFGRNGIEFNLLFTANQG